MYLISTQYLMTEYAFFRHAISFFSTSFFFWLCWIFVALHRLSRVVPGGGCSCCCLWTCHCGGFSCWEARSPDVWASVVAAHRPSSTGSAVVAHGLSCSIACGIFLDQGSNIRPLHWQVDSYPLYTKEAPVIGALLTFPE